MMNVLALPVTLTEASPPERNTTVFWRCMQTA